MSRVACKVCSLGLDGFKKGYGGVVFASIAMDTIHVRTDFLPYKGRNKEEDVR